MSQPRAKQARQDDRFDDARPPDAYDASSRAGRSIARPRLEALLDTSREARVTLITAGAGHGKTVLARTWSRQRGREVTWLDLRASDNSAATLSRRLASELGCDDSNDGTSMEVGDVRLPDATGRPLATDGRHRSRTIVLDQCEAITDPDAIAVLERVIDELPEHASLILISRVPLPLRLGRLRALGQVRQIDAGDLRFTVSETAELLELRAGIEFPDYAVWHVWRDSNGWATGIALGGVAVANGHGKFDPSRSLEVYWPRYIDDYVAQELLPSLNDAERRFVLGTASFPYLSSPMSQESFGANKRADELPRLVTDFSIVDQEEGEAARYRYYPVIGTSLERLEHDRPQFDRRKVRARAIRALLDRGEIRLAARLLQRSLDVIADAGLIEQVCRELVQRSDFGAILGVLSAVPESMILSSDELLYCLLVSKLALGQSSGIERWLGEAEQRWRNGGDPIFSGRFDLCSGLNAFSLHDAATSRRCLQDALVRLPMEAKTERLLAHTMLGQLEVEEGKDAAAEKHFSRAGSCAAALPLDEQWSWMAIAAERANTYAIRGDIFSAITKYELIIQELPKALAHLEGPIRSRLAALRIERREFDRAEDDIRRAARLMSEHGAELRTDLVSAKARLHLALGDIETAEALVAGYLKHVRRQPGKDGLVLILSRIWLSRNELPLVQHWLNDSASTGSRWIRAFGEITRDLVVVEFELAQGRLQDAARTAANLAERASATSRWSVYVEASVRQAVALALLGDRDGSEATMRRALDRGLQGGFVGSFLVPGYDTISMFEELWKETPRARDVRARYLVGSSHGGDGAAELLTPRELEILKRVALGDSNRDIAEALFISTNTVRNHLVKTFRRLDAGSRTGAVTRARDLGIIE